MKIFCGSEVRLKTTSIYLVAGCFLILAFLTLMLGFSTSRLARAAGTVGDGTASSCTETTFSQALAGGGLVSFNCGSSPITITLTHQKIITADTTIDGGGLVSLSGTTERLLAVNSKIALTLQNITLANGSSLTAGGAIASRGDLTIINSTFRNNSVGNTTDSYGGAIYGDTTSGGITITNSIFSNNSITGGFYGGGALFWTGASVNITGSTFSNNQGDAIYTKEQFGTVTTINNSIFTQNTGGDGGAIRVGKAFVNNSIFTNNTGTRDGGTIYAYNLTINNSIISNNYNKSGKGGGIFAYTLLNMNNTTISNNTASEGGGGLFAYPSAVTGNFTVTNSTIVSNTSSLSGGGIYIEGGANFWLINSTVANNSATAGGGVYHAGDTFTIVNSTISNNRARANQQDSRGDGGAVYMPFNTSMTIANSTLAGNSAGVSGGAIYLPDTFLADVRLKNTIVAASSPQNCNTLVTDSGYNLISDTSCGTTAIDPQIGPLQNNGGPTETHALLSGSPAINGGNPAGCTDFSNVTLTTDQRGFPRPSGGRCDVGAYEATLLTITSTDDASDVTPGDGVCETGTGNGICTLRAAIQEAESSTGSKLVVFNLALTDPNYNATTGRFVITPATPLPTLTSLTIDGSSQSEASCANIKLEINGNELASTGLTLNGGVTLKALLIHGFAGPQLVNTTSSVGKNILQCTNIQR